MSAIAASNVSFTLQGKGAKDSNGVRQNVMKIVFGNATLTYPAGGIPLSNLSKFGFPNAVDEVMIEDAANGDGYLYKWDKVNNKLRIYESPAVAGLAALTEVDTSFVPASNVTLYAQVRGH
jgi:hypothetical protein